MSEINGRQDVICKLAARDKFLSFQNGLVVAHPEHYAMLHGKGGKKYAAKSVIQLLATDYSGGLVNDDEAAEATGRTKSAAPDGKKWDSVVVKANIEPEIASIWENIALSNMGDVVANASLPGFWGMVIKGAEVAEHIKIVLLSLFGALREILRETVKGSKSSKEIWGGVGVGLKNAMDQLSQNEQVPSSVNVPFSLNYKYHAERVSPYSKSPDGKNFVTVLDVTRSGYRANGVAANMPWFIKIQNFWADPKEAPNGTISYIPGTESQLPKYQKKEVFIMASDADMYAACHRVSSFVRTWETAICTPYVRNGVIDKERERVENMMKYQMENGGNVS